MGKKELLAIQFKKTRLAMNNHSTLLLKIIKAPHVMITSKEVHLYSLVGKFGHLAKETGIAFGNCVAELIPEIKDIAEHIYGSSLILDFVKE